MKRIAKKLNMPFESYADKKRNWEISHMRIIAAMKIRECCPKIGVEKIAVLFGGQNHSTVVKGCISGYKKLKDKEEPFTSNYSKCSIAISKF